MTAEQLTTSQTILGTPAYMSPEQAEGRAVDPQSDIFSLGIVLYEMSTGQRPFRGDTAVSVISSIIKDSPPPPSDINRVMPHEVDRVIRRGNDGPAARHNNTRRGQEVTRSRNSDLSG